MSEYRCCIGKRDYYKKYHPEESTKGCVIVHLDNDKSNFAEETIFVGDAFKQNRRIGHVCYGYRYIYYTCAKYGRANGYAHFFSCGHGFPAFAALRQYCGADGRKKYGRQ